MRVTALAGGVGGAKLADGLAQYLPDEDLTVIVNTGDDFEHLGITICPDLDTVCYTLAGLANPTTGWGRTEETWLAMETVGRLGGPTWFQLGDRDIGLHLERTRRLRAGEKLSEITYHFCQLWGVGPRVLPMSDDTVSTWVYTKDGSKLPFQEYFVHQKCEPCVTGFDFENIGRARPAAGVLEAIQEAQLVVICPSNPWVSIDPILAVMYEGLLNITAPVVAVSPIIGGKAVKGPAAKMYAELGITPSAYAVAHHYRSLISGFIMDSIDSKEVDIVTELGIQVLATDILMKTPEDRRRLAKDVIEFGRTLIAG